MRVDACPVAEHDGLVTSASGSSGSRSVFPANFSRSATTSATVTSPSAGSSKRRGHSGGSQSSLCDDNRSTMASTASPVSFDRRSAVFRTVALARPVRLVRDRRLHRFDDLPELPFLVRIKVGDRG